MMKEKTRILVVDDEHRYVWTTQVILEARGYEVLVARDGETAVEIAANDEPDLIILDVKMPGMDGYDACLRIREFSTVPIIMLTALAEDVNKVEGLYVGADDYVTKPFSAEELLARIWSVLRRIQFSEQKESPPSFQAGELLVDFEQSRVYVSGQEVHLTSKEYQLLCELVTNAGQVLEPEYLLEAVWGMGHEEEGLLLRQIIHRLRRKIEPDPKNPYYIQTRVGLGYVFAPLE